MTGLQMINAYSTLANDGRMMRPYVVDRIVSPSRRGHHARQARGYWLSGASRGGARRARDADGGVTEEGGTGKRASVKGFPPSRVKPARRRRRCPEDIRAPITTPLLWASYRPANRFSVLVSVGAATSSAHGRFCGGPGLRSDRQRATARYLALDPDLPLDDDDLEIGATVACATNPFADREKDFDEIYRHSRDHPVLER